MDSVYACIDVFIFVSVTKISHEPLSSNAHLQQTDLKNTINNYYTFNFTDIKLYLGVVVAEMHPQFILTDCTRYFFQNFTVKYLELVLSKFLYNCWIDFYKTYWKY